jgi:hypothetical protein
MISRYAGHRIFKNEGVVSLFRQAFQQARLPASERPLQ